MREVGTFKITEVLIPLAVEGDFVKDMPIPKIEGYERITFQQVEIDGIIYDKFEYVPDWIDLCESGNAKREGNLIRILNPSTKA